MILFALSLWAQAESKPSPLVEAIQAEKMRGLALKLPEQESPYFIEYRVRDITSTTVYASFGSLEAVRTKHYRPYAVEVRMEVMNLTTETLTVLWEVTTGYFVGIYP